MVEVVKVDEEEEGLYEATQSRRVHREQTEDMAMEEAVA